MKKPVEAIIEDVIAEPSKIQPIIVQFQNGVLKDEEAKKLSCGIFHDKQKDKTVLALSNGHLVYRGYKPDLNSELTRTMLLFHNKRTGKVRLVEAERWQVGPILDKPSIDCTKDIGNDRIAELNKQFGSKKIKRRTEQFEKMKVNADTVAEELEKTVSNIEIDRLDLSTQAPNDDLSNILLPPCNRDAANVNDIYNVDDIIPLHKLETLYEKAAAALNGEIEGSSKFFTDTLQQLKLDSDKIRKVAILIYIEAAGAWLNIPIKDAKKRGIDVCPFSADVNTHIIDNYSVGSAHGRTRPNSMRDKGLIHCMILALIISNFSLDLELFSTLFVNKISMKKLTELARIVLAVPNKENKKIIVLKLPLPAEIAIIRKGKKK